MQGQFEGQPAEAELEGRPRDGAHGVNGREASVLVLSKFVIYLSFAPGKVNIFCDLLPDSFLLDATRENMGIKIVIYPH